jgi:hypothetical protein
MALLVGGVVAAAAVYVGLGLLAADTDRFGRVPVPGLEPLRLDRGEVDVFYAEDVSLPDDQSLAAPGDLALRIRGPDGQPLDLRRRSGQEVSGSGGTATLIASVDVPADGTYEVATRSATAAARSRPEVTLGESPFDAVGDRIEAGADVLFGPIGAGALGLLALLAAVAWVRRRSRLEGPTLPPESTG